MTVDRAHDEIKAALAMIKVLKDDCVAHRNAFINNDNQLHRRAFVRSVFAYIEGVLHQQKQFTYKLGDGTGKLSDEEMLRLKDSRRKTNQQGEDVLVPHFMRFKDNFKFTFSAFSKSCNSTFELDLNENSWNVLQASLKVRDRLMHPKSPEDLLITELEIQEASETFLWFSIVIYESVSTALQSVYEQYTGTASQN